MDMSYPQDRVAEEEHSSYCYDKEIIFTPRWNNFTPASLLSRMSVSLGRSCACVLVVAPIGVWRDRQNAGAPMERGIMNLMNADPPEMAKVEYEDELVLDPKVQESIGRSLKAHYDDLVNAPIPDKFLVLLAQLEATERRLSGEDGSHERS
jgi:hypothetical protein